jgi:aspartate-semialdehyde dehydrogenase
MLTVSVGFGRRVPPDEAIAALRRFRAPPCVAGLPSSPSLPIEIDDRVDRPQPRLDLDRGGGMAVTVGRVRPCPLLDLRLVVLGHNTVRGAAGQAVQIAELLVAEGRVQRGPGSPTR